MGTRFLCMYRICGCGYVRRLFEARTHHRDNPRCCIVQELVKAMSFPSKRAGHSPPGAAPQPKQGDLWRLCRKLDVLDVKECHLLAALVQIGQEANSGKLSQLISAFQLILGDREGGSLGSVLPKRHDLSADELGSLSVMIRARIVEGKAALNDHVKSNCPHCPSTPPYFKTRAEFYTHADGKVCRAARGEIYKPFRACAST